MKLKPIQSRAEKGAALAFVIAAAAIAALHFVEWVIRTLAGDLAGLLGWPLILLDLPSMPIYFLVVFPLDLADPLPYLCQILISALVWGVLCAMPTYIVISRSEPKTKIGST